MFQDIIHYVQRQSYEEVLLKYITINFNFAGAKDKPDEVST